MDTNIVNLYLVQHKISSSQTQIECALDEHKKPRISSIKMLSGKVIPLHGVRDALTHFKEECGLNNDEPDQSA